MLHQRASKNAIINKIMSNSKGIGESKAAAKAQSDIKGQNGQNISSKAHSIASTQNLRSVVTQYVNYVNDNHQGKPLANINSETMKDFINSKINDGLSLSSANTYISELGKISDNLNQLGVHSTSRDEITAFRAELKAEYGTLQSQAIDRTNNDTQAILSNMNNNTLFGVSAELQALGGLRVDDAINLNKLEVNQDNTITVNGSKNGLNYTTAALPQELIDRVVQSQEMGYQVNYNEYREALKEATEATGQEFKGTHSLRYDYANNKHEENINSGMTESESKSEISLNMGHSREEITNHYLK